MNHKLVWIAKSGVFALKKYIFIPTVAVLSLILVYLCVIAFKGYTVQNSRAKDRYTIYIDINEKTLYLLDGPTKEVVKRYPIATGKRETPSPIGTWKIINKGRGEEIYGGYWMGLNVPWGSFGIHGTKMPYSIGKSASNGCFRMYNRDAEELFQKVGHETTVVVYGGPYGRFGNGLRTMKLGDAGSDVFEVQRLMKQQGYYPYDESGIFGEGMKAYVIKFRKDKNLIPADFIDGEFYKALGVRLADYNL